MTAITITKSEKRFLSRYRKWDRHWPWVRWISLTASVGQSVMWILFLRFFMADSPHSSDDAVSLATALPLCWMMSFFWTGLCVWTLSQWGGDAKVTLLLKVLQALENGQAQQCAPLNGGPATPRGNSGVPGGPPSVS